LFAAELAARRSVDTSAGTAGPGFGNGYAILVQIHYEWNQLDEAERWVREGLGKATTNDEFAVDTERFMVAEAVH
jgi:hypothetical protein